MPEWMVYDAAVADAVQAHWYQLMDARPIPPDTGRVVLEFLLNSDGVVSDLFVVENTEGEILGTLCQKALLDPTPYAVWSKKMQSLFGGARRFRMKFEFDVLGVGYLDYAEDWTELARNNHPPAGTTIVLGYHRGAAPRPVLPN